MAQNKAFELARPGERDGSYLFCLCLARGRDHCSFQASEYRKAMLCFCLTHSNLGYFGVKSFHMEENLNLNDLLPVQPSAEVQVLSDKNWTKDEDLENARGSLHQQVTNDGSRTDRLSLMPCQAEQ